MRPHPFTPGKEYHRRNDIHARYKGQQYGGIATPSEAPYVFLFTGEAGEDFGYADDFQPDGLYWYTGEGQIGDMQMIRGNAAICHHRANQKSILLFEASEKAYVRFVGEMAYVAHHEEQRPDRDGQLRKAIVFHLELLIAAVEPPAAPTEVHELVPNYGKSPPLESLRQQALKSSPASASPIERLVNVRMRSNAIKRYALARSKGICEGCQAPAPFDSKHGPFLEVHHVHRLADGGPDLPQGVIALCPNCHRKAHYAKNAKAFNDELKNRLETIGPPQ